MLQGDLASSLRSREGILKWQGRACLCLRRERSGSAGGAGLKPQPAQDRFPDAQVRTNQPSRPVTRQEGACTECARRKRWPHTGTVAVNTAAAKAPAEGGHQTSNMFAQRESLACLLLDHIRSGARIFK